MSNSQIGVFGLGVMGRSIAQNLARNTKQVSGYSINQEEMQELNKLNPTIYTANTIEEFLNSLQKPRVILIMITAGKAIDSVIDNLLPLLDQNDIIIDAGNSHFKDSEKREKRLSDQGINFLSLGVSGGEKGALYGPSMMPSGKKEVYEHVAPLLESISAKASDNSPCCKYIGKGGSGHFVKMIHNGIEYADLEIISEIYGYLKLVMSLSNSEISNIFKNWNQGILKSYLLEIASEILVKKDPETGNDLIDYISGITSQKGTGTWSAQQSLELGIFAPSIYDSVGVRFSSGKMNLRKQMNELYKDNDYNNEYSLVQIESSFICSRIISYAQGLEIINQASIENDWNVNLKEVLLLWRAGCILQSKMVEILANYVDERYEFLLLKPDIVSLMKQHAENWKEFNINSITVGYPLTVITNSLIYFDLMTMMQSPTNIIQASRDYFGGHLVERIDKEGKFHYHWNEE